MDKIYSNIHSKKLLHVIVRSTDIELGRNDLIPSDNFIQCSTLRLDKGKTFKPHRHIYKWKEQTVIAQESWIVIKGKVRCIFYDVNDEVIGEYILNAGDASFTLAGGHNYEIIEDDTMVFEYKTGPYEGQKLDKVFI